VGHPVVGSDGDVIEVIGTHLDVTEQYAAKQALQKAFDEIKKSEDRLRLVIDTIPTLVWRSGPGGTPEFFNQPSLDYTGLSLDGAVHGWAGAVHPDDMANLSKMWRTIRKSGMRGETEGRLRRFDGEYRWFLFRAEPMRDEVGNVAKWYGSATDIEDRKRTEVALRESEQRFRDYAETASDWLWESGPDHRVTRISEHLNAIGIPPLTPNWRGSLGHCNRCRIGTRKMATASGDARRTSAISRFRLQNRKRERISGIRPNKRQAIF
jgi:PAS domain S-box-containing protein